MATARDNLVILVVKLDVGVRKRLSDCDSVSGDSTYSLLW